MMNAVFFKRMRYLETVDADVITSRLRGRMLNE